MKKVLLSCIALAAGSAIAMAQALPEYPDHLDFTMNGEKELTGVTVTQEMIPYDGDDYLTITINGECDADVITLDMVTPEGWDGMLVFSQFQDNSDIELLKSKAPVATDEDHWWSLELAGWLKEGNTLKFNVDGDEQQAMAFLVYGENYYTVNIDFIFEVKKVGGSVSDEPCLPDHINFTMNGETELPGISVRQGIDGTTNAIDIKGTVNSDKITVTFETPEGWDGMLISDLYGYGEISTVKTRGVEMIPAEFYTNMGFKAGNTITYDADGEANDGEIALIKGDMACATTIKFCITVDKDGGSEDPGELTFPDHYNVITFNEGLTVEQGVDKWGDFGIVVEGEVAEDTFSIVIDVPEGWDGFYCGDWSEDDVVITENTQDPKRTRSEELVMVPFSELDDNYFGIKYYKGNRFTLKPTYDPEYNNRQTIEIHLIKGDLVTQDYFNMDVCVAKGEVEDPIVPVFPENFDITTDKGVTATQSTIAELPEGTLDEMEQELISMFYCDNAVVISGAASGETTSVEFNLPKGWTGVQPFKVTLPDFGDYEYYNTRANAPEWQMLDDVKSTLTNMFGYFDATMEGSTKFDFNVGEKTVYLCYLYTETTEGGETFALADTANPFVVIVNVDGEEVQVPAFPDEFEVKLSCEGLNVIQEKDEFEGMEEFIITIEGTCPEESLTMTIEVPEGWDGFVGQTDEGFYQEVEPLSTRGTENPDLWQPISDFEEYGYSRGNTYTFSVDGEEHGAYLFLYKDDMVYGCTIYVEDLVMPAGDGVATVDKAASADYYDMNGQKVTNPTKGIYVKVVDGKASKVVVK